MGNLRSSMNRFLLLGVVLYAMLLVACGKEPATMTLRQTEEALTSLSKFTVEGQSSATWLSLTEEGSLAASGTLDTGEVLDSSRAVSLITPEQVEGLEVYHGIPLRLSSETEVYLEGRSVGIETFLELAEFGRLDDRLVAVQFALSSEANELPIAERITYSEQVVQYELPTLDTLSGTRLSVATEPLPAIWLHARTGEVTSLSAYVTMLAGSDDGERPFIEIMIPDEISQSPLFHILRIYGETEEESIQLNRLFQEASSHPESTVIVRAKLDDGVLHVVE